MPYVDEYYRNKVDQNLNELIEFIGACGHDKDAGVLNYCITRLLHGLAGPYDVECKTTSPIWNYDRINKAQGVLSCVSQEFYRRVAAPYEDQKIQTAGDVEEYRVWYYLNIEPPRESCVDLSDL